MNLFRILSFASLAGFPPALLAEIDFNRDIRPILSDHCYACHGPDAKERKGELRLDLKEAALGGGESGERAIVPGDLEKSELIRRVTSTDRDEMMPPKKATKRLNPAQIGLLERWVEEGAKWTGHWAFEHVKPAPPPDAQRLDSPIDAFVQARLLKEGLAIAPEEEKARLIRRLSLDLTGLPPEMKHVDAFVAGADSYENVVDRLLASAHFGERLALPWLDLARYGDTSGYHNDSLRDMWLWREWVVNAFNANMSFDQFTIEQLAGDLLPNPTLQQQVASGFHRNVMTSDEGGLIESEYLDIYVVDRVNTTGTVWLGLTVQCAECHDHKYDPITQRDYYGLYAFFHNVPESGKDGVRDRNPKPFLRVPTGEQQMKFAALDRDIGAAEQAALALEPKLDELQRAWEAQLLANGPGELPAPAAVFPLDDGPAGRDAAGNPIVALLHGEATFVDGAVSKSFRIEAKGHIDVGDHFGFEKDQPFSASAWLRLKPKTGAPFGKMEPGPLYRGWDLEIQDGKPTVHLIHKWPEEAIHVVANDPLPFDTFHHVAFTYDGSGKAAGVRIFVNGTEIKTKAERDNLTGSIVTKAPFRIGRRGDSNFTGRVDDLRIYARKLEGGMVAQLGAEAQLAIVKIPEAERSASQKQTLQKFFRESQASEYQAAQKRIADLKKAKEDLDRQVPNTMVMAELEKPRDTFIKLRGNYDQNGEKVSAAVPAFLPQVPPRADGKPLNRLDLARWLVSKEHPLTARVAVNRWWTMLFGTGLVKTGNDFGSQGEWPSHPELLDWLAADFATDWNIKRSIKQIVMSATYRRGARATTELLARDSENRLLARGPRQRLDAELLRDNALAIAGILNPQLGGKSIKPAQPPGTWEINEMSGYSYQKSTGADLYRRGLYVYWRRSTVYPSFITLDAPTREFCVAQRAKTSTPLQSLVLMNDPVFVEAARAFAQRVLREGGSDNATRLRYAWRLALARQPADAETAILAQTLEAQLMNYSQNKAAAEALVKVGDLPKPQDLADAELAAWTTVANVLLNLNETISN